MHPRDRQFLTSSPLVPGDTVALLSPASWSEPDWVTSSVATLKASGLRVALGEHATDQLGYLAGRDEDRLADLNSAIRDPRVRAVLTLRGGCGSFRLVHGVDVAGLRQDPKPLVGFSDITALHRVWHLTGVASLHGCVAGAFAEDTLAQLKGTAPSALRSDHSALTAALTTSGTAEGRLFGGSLEMLARSVGVLELDLRDHVLLLEANRAAGLGMIDRALAQLRMSGSLDGITGV
ncbi:MAG: LD-carboxypeptidase, partial [Propionibacteriaceae bacterium]